MPPPRDRKRFNPWLYGPLAPFALVGLYSLTVLVGWMLGNVWLVQPRSTEAALPGNACLCLLLISLCPISRARPWRRTTQALAGLAALLAGATMLQSLLGTNFGIDNLLVRHEALVAGEHIGRMPAALAALLLSIALYFFWTSSREYQARHPLILAIMGSLAAAYGLAGLFASRTGLNTIDAWKLHGLLGSHTAIVLLVLGGALILLAARDHTGGGVQAGPRWLWLPLVICSLTVTIIFWIALQQRELNYTNSTTQLAIANIASLFSGECENQIENVTRFAARWKRPEGRTQQDWENEADAMLQDYPGYRSLQWVDAGLHTRWYWPRKGNEDAPFVDHAGQIERRAAVDAARSSGKYGIAAPLESPIAQLQRPTFAIYIPNQGTLDGFTVGELYYEPLFDLVDRRLNLARRYQLSVTLTAPSAPGTPGRKVEVYTTLNPEEALDPRLRQSLDYKLYDRRMTISLTPRPAFLSENRQFLPELALYAGLGVSILFGLVVNLAQAARRRQYGAEQTAEQLLAENEERRRIEARLKTTDERLNLALDSTQLGVYEWDVETDQVYFTPSIWKMIGYEPGEMPNTGQGWLNLLHVDDQPAVRAVIDAHFRGETPFIEIEHCVLHRNGDWLWIALRAKCTAFSASRRPLRVLGTIQNINARKRADEALRSSQAESRKLSLVASKTDNAVIITDHAGRIEWVNESYARLTGRRLPEVTGLPLTALLANPDDDSSVLERISQAIQARAPISTDVIQSGAHNTRRHVHLEAQPITNDEGLVENFIAIATDITTRIETEQQLRRAKSDADATSRAKSDFLATMSHEIRTPMNGVIGMTSLLLETELTAEQRDYVSTIRTSGDALLSIINEILDFSKIESGKMELEQQPFEIAQCVEEAIDIFALHAAGKDIELAYHIDAAVPRCLIGDITRLRQVLVNLVNNAIKFTPRGFVTIEVRLVGAATPAPDEIAAVEFRVTDTGIGIPSERLDMLFKPFSQVDSSTTRKYGGTGLGLAICDRLCQLMGGHIAVTSAPGQGSCFHFTIRGAVVGLGDLGAPLFAPIPGGGHVLAVDDHPVNRAMLGECLQTWQLPPLLAATADDAVALAETTPLAAAIIDHDLAGTPGQALATRLRTLRPHLPIILYTAAGEGYRGNDNDPLLFRLPKPIKPYALHESLRHAIIGSSPFSGSNDPATGSTVPLAESLPLDILLVEDNLVNQKVALRLLQRLGYRADAVANGLEAVQALKDRNYKLLFMDLQMPEMDGFAATQEIRAKFPQERQPVIIALTANAMQGDRERCLAAGMDDYITKPVKLDDIEKMIRRFFALKPGSA